MLMVAYDVFLVYVVGPFSPRGWAGMGNAMLLIYVTLPVFVTASLYLGHFLKKNDYTNAMIPGITCAIIILALIYMMISK